ncbi:MAG: hypothetical protein D6675_15625 [Gemmatimonadetes bacterium]|nr:MAG: hypothetical protein D6675_15625 [Gemmatimonadota bacterium]
MKDTLLAVDVGVRTGLALYGFDGKLIWYRSHNFGKSSRLRRGVPVILAEIPDMVWVVLEGSGTLAEVWVREAEKRHLNVRQVPAEVWRKHFFYPREQRSAVLAKRHADEMARKVIDWSGAPRPTSLRHDAAEAILVGLWGVLDVGWLKEMPPPLKR